MVLLAQDQLAQGYVACGRRMEKVEIQEQKPEEAGGTYFAWLTGTGLAGYAPPEKQERTPGLIAAEFSGYSHVGRLACQQQADISDSQVFQTLLTCSI